MLTHFSITVKPVSQSDQQRARERRRRLFQRQSKIFGATSVVLVAVFLVSLLQFFNVIPSPFTREFSTKEDQGGTMAVKPVCPPQGSVPVDPASFKVNVFNGTSRAGLAATVKKELQGAGFKPGDVGNFDAGYDGTVLIRVGADQIEQGYTLSRLFDNPLVVFSERDTEGIDLILGAAYEEMGSKENIGTEPFAAPEGCVGPDGAADEGEQAPGNDQTGDAPAPSENPSDG